MVITLFRKLLGLSTPANLEQGQQWLVNDRGLSGFGHTFTATIVAISPDKKYVCFDNDYSGWLKVRSVRWLCQLQTQTSKDSQ